MQEETRYAAPPRSTVLEKIAKTVSGIFSPLLVPTYAFVTALWLTPLAESAERVRFLTSFLVFAITAAVPMFTIIFLMRSGTVSDPSISNRRERLVPYIVTTLCYIGAAMYVHSICTLPGRPSPCPWLYNFFYGAAIASGFSCIVNHFWKISAHMTSMGGYTAFVVYLYMHKLGIVDLMPWITALLLISGAVGSSRLVLNRHTQLQLLAGFITGFAAVTLVL